MKNLIKNHKIFSLLMLGLLISDIGYSNYFMEKYNQNLYEYIISNIASYLMYTAIYLVILRKREKKND